MPLLSDDVDWWLIFCVIHTNMANIRSHIDGVLRCRGSSSQDIGGVLLAIVIDVMLTEVLAAEGAYELELLKLVAISVNKTGPLVHFVSGLFVELILEVVVLLLELLGQFPDDIILELEELSLLLVVVHKDSSLRQLSWQVVGEHIDLNLEVLGASILDVVIKLPVLVKELQLVRTEGVEALRLDLVGSNLFLVT